MKVIFLDVDGVLNTYEYLNRGDEAEKKVYGEIDIRKVRLLAEIVRETGAEIVLSSTWRADFDDQMQPLYENVEMFLKAFSDCGLTILDKTKDLDGERSEEVKEWLSRHPETDSCIILDDYPYKWMELSDRWIQTDFLKGGLMKKHVKKAVRMLNRKKS